MMIASVPLSITVRACGIHGDESATSPVQELFAVLHGTNKEQRARRESPMSTIDASFLSGLATLVTSLAGLVWAFRRKS